MVDPATPRLTTYVSRQRKKLKAWFSSHTTKNEDAAELYGRAAAQYKISKHWLLAGNAYRRAAECSAAAKDEISSQQQWKEAGKMYAKVDSALAVEAYGYAIEFAKERDKFSQAARLTEEIAGLLEEEDHIDAAIEQYLQSADLFETESDETNANKRLLKAAHLQAKLRRYEDATELFEKVAKHNAENHLLRWNVKTLLFKSFLCAMNYLCIRDDPSLWERIDRQYLDKYRGMSDLFASSRECALCASLATCVPALDLDAMKESVIKFDSIQRLEPWHNEQILNLEVYITDKKGAAPDLDETGPSAAGSSGPDLSSAAATAAADPFAASSSKPDTDGDSAFGVSTTLGGAYGAPDLDGAPEL